MDKLLGAAREAAQRVIGSPPLDSLRAIARSRLPRSDEADRGQGLAEYALILAGIAIVAIASLIFLGGNISDMFWDPISEEFGDVLRQIGLLPPAPPP